MNNKKYLKFQIGEQANHKARTHGRNFRVENSEQKEKYLKFQIGEHEARDFCANKNTRARKEECSICLEDITGNTTTLPCKHKFHSDCIVQLAHKKCPMCRRKISSVIFNHLMERHIDRHDLLSNRQPFRMNVSNSNLFGCDFDDDNVVSVNSHNIDRYIPLQSWVNLDPGLAIPLCAIPRYVDYVEPATRWVEFPGERLIERVSLEINGNVIDEYTHHSMNLWQEFAAPNRNPWWSRCVGASERDVSVPRLVPFPLPAPAAAPARNQGKKYYRF